MDILHQFGIEAKLLVVQLINFVILALVFWKFILPRLTSLMNERQTQIRDSLAEAEKARAEVEQAQAARDEELERAKQEADRVIAEATEQAQTEASQLLAQARADADATRARQQEQLSVEREKLRADLRAEMSALVVETTRKVLTDVVKPTDQKRMVAAASSYLKRNAKAPRARK